MLHEIILALHGCMNSILNNSTHALELAKVLHPSEKALLRRLIQVGETYGQLQIFIEKHIYPHIEYDSHDASMKDYESHRIEEGMYLQAFCDGLHKVLQPYRNDIVALEKIALRDPYISLTSINNLIGGHAQLLCVLDAMVNEVKDDHLHGCKLLQYVCKQLCTGVDTMRDAVLEIAKCCHSVLIKQLTNWLIYGELMDKYSEFFIKANNRVSSGEHNMTLTKSPGSDNHITLTEDGSTESLCQKGAESEFILDEDYIPPYISHTTAHKILYIGKTVKLFKCDLTGKSEFGKVNGFHQEELDSVKKLQDCSFQDAQQLESAILNLESSVTQRLWSLAVDQADLMGQLKAMKDFYLLSRGELFVDFLNRIGVTLNKPLSSNVVRDLNTALVVAARNVQYFNESVLEKFHFKLPAKDSSNAAVKVKSVLRLEYQPTIPLHLFFSPVVVDNYNVLFQFFLRVKQVQLNLHSAWLCDVKNKKQLLTDKSWRLRNDLMFLVENLQCYLQWDVVESEYATFLNELKRTEDFEHIRRLHHRFLFNVLSQAFLIPNDAKFDQSTGLLLISTNNQNSKPNTAIVFLSHILDLSESFCHLVTQAGNVDISDSVESMSDKLKHCVKVLVRLITNLRNQVSGVHLSKLLLRLDYNHYFSYANATLE